MNMNKEKEIHDFHMHLIDACGVGYYEFREFLNNLDDNQILEELDLYVKEIFERVNLNYSDNFLN